jgi:hypothetical protein
MSTTQWVLVIGAALLLALTGLGWLITLLREVHLERARELFRLQRERLAERFRLMGDQSGKPRGLRWVRCELGELLTLVRERQTRQLLGLVAVVLHFEALPDGDMVDVPAVGLPRHATAVFCFRRGEWLPTGRAVMNLSPAEVLEQFSEEFERIDSHP